MWCVKFRIDLIVVRVLLDHLTCLRSLQKTQQKHQSIVNIEKVPKVIQDVNIKFGRYLIYVKYQSVCDTGEEKKNSGLFQTQLKYLNTKEGKFGPV